MARILESSNFSATLSVTALGLLPPALEILGLEISFIWRPSPNDVFLSNAEIIAIAEVASHVVSNADGS